MCVGRGTRIGSWNMGEGSKERIDQSKAELRTESQNLSHFKYDEASGKATEASVGYPGRQEIQVFGSNNVRTGFQ